MIWLIHYLKIGKSARSGTKKNRTGMFRFQEEGKLTYYEAIKNLTCEQMEKYLDQVFLTGMNTGYQSLVDPSIHDGNPFKASWLSEDVKGPIALVEDEAGENLIIEQLVRVVSRIVEFDTEAIPDDLRWQMQVVLPKSKESANDFCDK